MQTRTHYRILRFRVVEHNQSGINADKLLGQMVRSPVVRALCVKGLHLLKSYHLVSQTTSTLNAVQANLSHHITPPNPTTPPAHSTPPLSIPLWFLPPPIPTHTHYHMPCLPPLPLPTLSPNPCYPITPSPYKPPSSPHHTILQPTPPLFILPACPPPTPHMISSGEHPLLHKGPALLEILLHDQCSASHPTPPHHSTLPHYTTQTLPSPTLLGSGQYSMIKAAQTWTSSSLGILMVRAAQHD